MSDRVVDEVRREWVHRVLGVVFGQNTNEDAEHRKALLDRISVAAASARALPAEQVPAFVSRAKAAKALAESHDLMGADIAVEQLEALLVPGAADKQRISAKRQALREQVEALTCPAYAGEEAAAALAVEKEKAAAALTDEQPSEDQFAAAEQAVTAFNQAAEAEKIRVTEAAEALRDEADDLTDPPYAGPDALAVLELEREKAVAALQDDTPTNAEMIEAERAIAAFQAALLKEQARVENERKTLLEQVALLIVPAWADANAADELEDHQIAATQALTDELPTPAQFEDAAEAIAAFGVTLSSARQRVTDKPPELLRKLAALTDPVGAGADELADMRAERDTATAALNGETPLPDDIVAAEKAVATLAQLIRRSANLSALGSQRPQAAEAARQAFASFKAVNGNLDVTDEVVADARYATELARVDCDKAKQIWDDAHDLSDSTRKKAQLKNAALEAARLAYLEAARKHTEAVKRENALRGQKALSEAIAHGPLSAESGRPFEDGMAAKLIAGYQRDAQLTDTAVKAAATAEHPEIIAVALESFIELAASGFKASDNTRIEDPARAKNYAGDLIKMAGDVGPEYFVYLQDYLDSGQHLTDKPLGNENRKSSAAILHQRTVAVAEALVQPDGSTGFTTDAAADAIGNALYHPNSLRLAMPALNAQILKTVDLLSDATTGPQADKILQDMTKPKKGAEALVRKSLNKEDDEEVDEQDARVAVVATMLKPFAQGPVACCFSTAPARNMRQQEPLKAMEAFADIASKGSYKPANCEKVPVVTRVPDEEDPIMRSWEYSLATSAARTGASKQKSKLNKNIGCGLDQLKTIAVDQVPATEKDETWDHIAKKLKNIIADEFTFNYDPLQMVTDANDGSSRAGRYVVQRVTNKIEITTKDVFIEQMAEIALGALGIASDAPAATQVKDLINSDAFIDAVCPGKYKPWELPSGGQTEAACQTLFGASITKNSMLPKAPKTAPTQPEGVRTTEVLSAFINNLGDSAQDMVPVSAVGVHGFNALPNHPSLAPLKGADSSDTAAKIQTNLIDKGHAIANTELSADRAAWLFDQEIQRTIDRITDYALTALVQKGAEGRRPRAAMKPQALTIAIKEALDDCHTELADRGSKNWEQNEIDAGKAVDPASVLKKKHELKADYDSNTDNRSKSALIRDMGAPEFVIADTNWGDGTDHTFFVISPDPATGEPKLWKKTVPPGFLEAAGRDWIDREWASIN